MKNTLKVLALRTSIILGCITCLQAADSQNSNDAQQNNAVVVAQAPSQPGWGDKVLTGSAHVICRESLSPFISILADPACALTIQGIKKLFSKEN